MTPAEIIAEAFARLSQDRKLWETFGAFGCAETPVDELEGKLKDALAGLVPLPARPPLERKPPPLPPHTYEILTRG